MMRHEPKISGSVWVMSHDIKKISVLRLESKISGLCHEHILLGRVRSWLRDV